MGAGREGPNLEHVAYFLDSSGMPHHKKKPPGCEPGGVSVLSHAGRNARDGILDRMNDPWPRLLGGCLSGSNRPPSWPTGEIQGEAGLRPDAMTRG